MTAGRDAGAALLRVAAALGVVLFALSSGAAPAGHDRRVVRLRAERSVAPGLHTVVVSLYATAESETPLASESRSVLVDDLGEFSTTFEATDAIGTGNEERWLGVRVPPGAEGPRRKFSVARGWPVTVLVVTDAAITANGIIESVNLGFRFPDGTVQTTASTATSGFGAPVSVGSANAAGASNAASRSDHVHGHGTHSNGTLHAAATTSAAGFMSAADKTKLDGTKAYVRTFIVSPVLGNATASGTALINTHLGILPDASNPALLKIEPGFYDIGNATLAMRPYVDIEGSGQNATFIIAARSNAAMSVNAAAVGCSAFTPNAEISNLTITNTGSGLANAIGFYAAAPGGNVRHVTINVSGGTAASIGILHDSGTGTPVSNTTSNTTIRVTGTSINYGIFVGNDATVVTRDSSSTVSGGTSNRALFPTVSSAVVTVDSSNLIANGSTGDRYAVYVNDGTATIYNSVLRAEGTGAGNLVGVRTGPGVTDKAYLAHSSIHGSTLALQHGVTSTLQVATSMVDGLTAGSPTCIYNYDATFAAKSCP